MKLWGCILLITIAWSCSQTFTPGRPNPEYVQLLAFHKRIAILPVLVYGRLPHPRREGNLQQTFFETLSRQINREKQRIAIQSFIETNEILKNERISYRQAAQMNKAELCRILGVDAVFVGNLDPGRHVYRGDQGVTMTGRIYDKNEGQMVWNKELTMLASSVYDTRYRMLVVTTADMARQLPY